MSSVMTTEVSPAAPAPVRAPEWPLHPPAPAPRRGDRRPFLAGLAGLLCGAFAVGGLWLGTTWLDQPAQGPSGDATLACEILERLPLLTADNLAVPNGSRLYAASELSAAAAATDQRYQRLAEATRGAYLSSSTLDAPSADQVQSVNQQVAVAIEECGR